MSNWMILNPRLYSDTTQLNSTQLPVVDPCRRRVGGSERRDPVEVVCGS